MDIVFNWDIIWLSQNIKFWQLFELNSEIDFSDISKLKLFEWFNTFWVTNINLLVPLWKSNDWKYLYLLPNNEYNNYSDYIKETPDNKNIIFWVNILDNNLYIKSISDIWNIAIIWWTGTGKTIWIVNILKQINNIPDITIKVFDKGDINYRHLIWNNYNISYWDALSDNTITILNDYLVDVKNQINFRKLSWLPVKQDYFIVLDEYQTIRRKSLEINPLFDKEMEFLLEEWPKVWIIFIIWSQNLIELWDGLLKNINLLFVWRTKHNDNKLRNQIFINPRDNNYIKFLYNPEQR